MRTVPVTPRLCQRIAELNLFGWLRSSLLQKTAGCWRRPCIRHEDKTTVEAERDV
jgi:hypothetical protein